MSFCVICAEECDPSETHSLPCGHSDFHVGCIVEWFRQGKSSCPLCRSSEVASMTTLERERRLKQFARRKSAPASLVRLVKKVKSLSEAHLSSKREEHVARLQHHSALKSIRMRERRVRESGDRLYEMRERLQRYVHSEVNVPLVSFEDCSSSDSDSQSA